MKPKLRACILALMFPFVYLTVRNLTSLAVRLTVSARVNAASHGLTEEIIGNRIASELEPLSPWVIIISAVITAAAAFFIFRSQGINLRSSARIRALEPASLVPGLAAVGVALNVALTLVFVSLPLPESWFSEHENRVSAPLDSGGFALQVICAALVVPLIEELLFRGIAMRFLLGAFPARMAILWQAVLFAAFHGTKLQLVYVFPAAVVLGWLFYRCGSLAAPIIAHMAFNLYSCLSPPVPASFLGKLALLAAALGIVAFGLSGIHRRSKKPMFIIDI